MRIALFGSGSPQSLAAFARLQPAVVVVPRAPWAKPLADAARNGGSEVLEFGDIAPRLRALRIDLLCVASFPHRLSGELLQIPAINAHPSLLPRHRGVDPIFWTYYCADEKTGVTVHWLDEKLDAGPLLMQREVVVPRAKPSRELYFELSTLAADLLAESVAAIDAGTAPRIAQDESRATNDPSSMNVRTNFGAWPVARAWHFLAGMSDQRTDLVSDANGVTHTHGRALSWDDRSTTPGNIVETRAALEIHCHDGRVLLERGGRSVLRRLASLAKRAWR